MAFENPLQSSLLIDSLIQRDDILLEFPSVAGRAVGCGVNFEFLLCDTFTHTNLNLLPDSVLWV